MFNPLRRNEKRLEMRSVQTLRNMAKAGVSTQTESIDLYWEDSTRPRVMLGGGKLQPELRVDRSDQSTC